MKQRSDRAVLGVVSGVAAAAALALAALWLAGPAIDGRDLVTATLLVPLIVAGRLFPLQVAHRRRMVTDTAPLFAASLLLPPALAVTTVLVALVPAELYSGLRSQLFIRQVVFNSSQALLGVLASGFAFGGFAGPGVMPPDAPVGALRLLGAGAVMLAANDLLVFAVVWAQMGLRFRRMAADYLHGRNDLPFDIALYGAGAAAALAGSANPFLLVLIVLPLPLLYRAMRNQVALRLQTREAVIALADIVDTRDEYTYGHCKRVAEFARTICAQLGYSPDLTDEIVLAARVHDVGKIGIRDAVLLKASKLTEEEFAHIREHPEIGASLTARFPDFARGTRYIRHHHECWDGSGYPSGLRGKEIPMGARIIAVADTFDAITSTRVYRGGRTDDFARCEMARVAGTQLDPDVVVAWFVARGWAWPEAEREARAA